MGRGTQSIHLVIAEAEDVAAAWLAHGLRDRGLRVELVTPTALCDGATLEQRMIGAATRLRIALADSRVLDGDRVAGVVNRMVHVPLSVLARSEPEDRIYVEAEWRALLCSLVGALPGPVIEPPYPHSLMGRWRSLPEWLVLAHRAGLPTSPWVWADGEVAPSVDTEVSGIRLLVIGDQVVSLDPKRTPKQVAAASQRLAILAGLSVLEVRLVDDGRLSFAFADQMPDLRDGGDRVLAAFERLFNG